MNNPRYNNRGFFITAFLANFSKMIFFIRHVRCCTPARFNRYLIITNIETVMPGKNI